MWFRDIYGEKSFADVENFLSQMDKKLVTCWMCSKVFEPEFYTENQNDWYLSIDCPYCKYKWDEGAMPDLFY